MQVGDLCYDLMTETLWIIRKITFNTRFAEHEYELCMVGELREHVIANERVVSFMRADYLKRTKNVLDKS